MPFVANIAILEYIPLPDYAMIVRYIFIFALDLG